MILLNRNVTNFTKSSPVQPVTNVRVFYGYDSDGAALYAQAATSPDDGRAIDVEIKTITSGAEAAKAADNILAQLGGIFYPYDATEAALNPAAELGDEVTVNGITSVLGSIVTQFHQGMWAEVSAPGLPEDQDFPYSSPTERAAERAEINTEVNSAKIAVNADAITAEVTRATGAESGLNTTLTSKITQTANEVRIDLKDYADTAVGDHAAEQQRYIRYSADGLELGEEGSMAQARLTNTKLSFRDVNGAEKAYIGQDPNDGNVYKFFVINGHIVNQLELGDHWLLIASGSENDYRLTFKWKA